MIGLVAVAKNQIECHSDFEYDDDEKEEEEDNDDNIECPSFHFEIDGKELNLPAAKGKDSLNYRIETIRQFIEQGLGLDTFIRVYKFLSHESDAMSDEQMNEQLKQLLPTPEKLKYYSLIQQLIICEETLQNDF